MINNNELSQEVEAIRKLLADGRDLTDAQMEVLFLAAFLEEEVHGRR